MQEFKNDWDKAVFSYSQEAFTRFATAKGLLNKALEELAKLEGKEALKHTEDCTTPTGINMKLMLSFRIDKTDKQRITKAQEDIKSILAGLESKNLKFFQLEECRVCQD